MKVHIQATQQEISLITQAARKLHLLRRNSSPALSLDSATNARRKKPQSATRHLQRGSRVVHNVRLDFFKRLISHPLRTIAGGALTAGLPQMKSSIIQSTSHCGRRK